MRQERPDRPAGAAGIYYEASQVDRIPPYDRKVRRHYWIVPVVFQIVDPHRLNGPVYLDQENLVLISGMGCYYCEREFSPRVAVTQCPGEPK